MTLHEEKTIDVCDLLPGVRFEKVVCWVNSTCEFDEIVDVGKQLASIGKEPCHVVMCLDPEENGGSACGRSPLTPELIAVAVQNLEELYGREVHTMVLPGNPVKEIRRYVRNHNADVVVLGVQAREAEARCDERLADSVSCAVVSLVLPKSIVIQEEKRQRKMKNRRC